MPEWRIKLAAATEGTTAHLWLLLLLVVDITIICKLSRASQPSRSADPIALRLGQH
eukprot:COSAG06_NODE_6572_length_2875_cov_1.938761_5_plen_55_part_01